MTKQLTCIECPKSCILAVDIENCLAIKVSGNKCPKGQVYAKDEIENPKRILTAAVLAIGLSLKMIPVRTDKPIPKAKILEAAAEIKKLRVKTPQNVGDCLAQNFLGLGVNLIVTRLVKKE